MKFLLLVLGLLLIIRPLPTLLLSQSRDDVDFVDLLEIFVDGARSGSQTATALRSALGVEFIPNDQLAGYIQAKFPTNPLAAQFALMWQSLYERGTGIVEGATLLAAIGRERAAQAEELAAKTSGARSTFRLLVGLPIWFLVIGELVGLSALRVLLTHAWGYALLLFAVAMMWSGHRWMTRILASL